MHNPSLSAAQTGGIRAIISSCLGEVHTYRTWKNPHAFSADPSFPVARVLLRGRLAVHSDFKDRTQLESIVMTIEVDCDDN